MPSTPRFHNKVVFITGAGSGIGRATATAFADEGARVVVTDLPGAGHDDTAAAIIATGGTAIAIDCDVRSASGIAAALDATIDTYGRLDAAVNNAGAEQDQTPVVDLDVDEWDRLMSIDLRGVFVCMKHEIRVMTASGGGTIVNVSSGAGVIGIAGQGAYAAAKHGVIGLTKSAALETIGDGVRINAVSPGFIDTEMIERVTGGQKEAYADIVTQEPIGRIGRPDEIAAAILWLSSGDSSFTVGHNLVVDGAQTIG